MIQSRREMEMGEYFQCRESKAWDEVHVEHDGSPPENPLLLFCDLILKYEKYKQTEEMIKDYPSSSSDEKTNDSFSSEPELSFNDNYSSKDKKMDVQTDAESWDLDTISCFCLKPFKGRPMIECNSCRVWYHMSCVKVKASNVPDIFICPYCQNTSSRKRRSERIRSDDRRFSP